MCVCVVVSDMKHYQRALLPPVTAQPSHMSSVVASILEHHTAELSAAQEWDNEWNSQGLLSHLTPQAKSPTYYTQQHCMNTGGSLFRPGSFQDLDSCRAQVLSEIKIVIYSIRTILGSVPTLFWRTTRPQCQSTMLVCDLPLLNRCVCCWTGVSQQEAEEAAETHRGSPALCGAAPCWKCLWGSVVLLGPVGAPAHLQVLRPLWQRHDQRHPLHTHPEVHLHKGELPLGNHTAVRK